MNNKLGEELTHEQQNKKLSKKKTTYLTRRKEELGKKAGLDTNLLDGVEEAEPSIR